MLLAPSESAREEYYSNRIIAPTCSYSYQTEHNNSIPQNCYTQTSQIIDRSSRFVFSNESITKIPLNDSVTMHKPDDIGIFKSKVKSSSIPLERYDNVGEPSFASNGTLIFYTGNHYAARSIDGKNWQYVDPYLDFQAREIDPESGNPTGRNMDLFWADQRTIYDPSHGIYIWVRQGQLFVYGGSLTNIDRIAISKDTIHWTAYDIMPASILYETNIRQAYFDYPEIVIAKDSLFLTSSVIDDDSKKAYGLVFRFSLDDLSKFGQVHLDTMLDREVPWIAPVDGASDPMYFGTHLPNNKTHQMKLYEWNEGSARPATHTVSISPWNKIHNSAYCSSISETWWCKSYTSSRIRSSWLYNNSLNFLWNAVTTYDDGRTWVPFIDVATFGLGKNMHYERKYYLADRNTPWIFGAAIPDKYERLGIIGYYVDGYSNTRNIEPQLNFAFGKFNETSKKWDMTSLVNSSETLPVINEDNKEDYNWGDFITIRKHIGPVEDRYAWDLAGYVLTGKMYHDVEPYFIMVK